MKTAIRNYALATEVAELRGLIKGYGDTHANSLRNYELIYQVIPLLTGSDGPARVKALRKAAQKDDAGKSLLSMLDEFFPERQKLFVVVQE